MRALHQTAIALAISTVFSSFTFAAPPRRGFTNPTPETNAAAIAENKKRIKSTEDARYRGQKSLAEAARANWKSSNNNRETLEIHTGQIRSNRSSIEKLQQTLHQEGLNRADSDTILRDVIDEHTKELGQHHVRIAENKHQIQSMYNKEKGERIQTDEELSARIKDSKTIITTIEKTMATRSEVITQLKSATGDNKEQIKTFLDTLDKQQKESQKQRDDIKEQALMMQIANKKRSALEEQLHEKYKKLQATDEEILKTLDTREKQATEIRQQLIKDQQLYVELLEDKEALQEFLERQTASTNAMNDTIDKNHKIALSGIAQAMAQAALPQAYDGKNLVSIGGGNFKGENAVAIGFSSNFGRNNEYVFKASVSSANKGTGGNVGVGFSF